LAKKEEIGLQIQLLRKRANLSIRQVAGLADVTAGMISCVERGKSSPSLAMLRKILTALGTDLGTFFGSGEAKQDGPVLLREGMQVVTDNDRRYTLVFPRRKGVEVQMLDEHFSPASRKPPFEKLNCTVAGYVVTGSLVLEGKGPKKLRSGDAFYVSPGVEHRGYAGTEAARVITVYSPTNY
jgi:transcriptional regulator with XRE-family HTH domain